MTISIEQPEELIIQNDSFPNSPVAIHGYRSCIVKEAFLNVLTSIGFIDIKKTTGVTIQEINEEIRQLEQAIIATEEKKESFSIEQDLELIKNLTIPIKNSNNETKTLLECYQEKIQCLNNIKKHRNPKQKDTSNLKIDIQVLLQPNQKYKVFFPSKMNVSHIKSKEKESSLEEVAYRTLVYDTVNQFLKASVGDQHGREQFYNLISSCTNGYIALEESSKQK